ncbi:N-acetylglucosamine-6-phosphate deacetylase [Catenovulum sp. 2E275]|nr:N-acetylglucosamine-6-phosphate deacetylase [Catenovulum sp. 2E275]
MKQQFRPQQLFDGQQLLGNPLITVENGRVSAIELNNKTTQAIELQGMLSPGFIDVQVNGGGGLLFNNAPNLNTLKQMSYAHSQFGSTGIMPTVITDDIEIMKQAADAVSQAISINLPGILGIHFEGPHLSVPKKGVHPQAHIRAISAAEWQVFERNDLGIKMITLAPECVSPDDIKHLKSLGWIICLGHSNTDLLTAQNALNAGANGFTHLFNAMSPLTSREPGMVGAALMAEQAFCGIIIDHHHVHPEMAKLAFKLKGADKLALVTDAMALIGSDQNSFSLFGETIYLNQDKLTILTGQLAGSHLSMQQAVKNCVNDLQLPLSDVLKMATSTPAHWLNQSQKLGKIAVGYPADWVLLDQELNVTQSWFSGINREQTFKIYS